MTSDNAQTQLSPAAKLNAVGLASPRRESLIHLNARWHRFRVRGVDP